ncbi:MAG: FHA domain-containing protein [Sandaracinaceae bacterium]|nr:FHA domain-containing protein [Sandaracinaceae bacterium]
MPGFRLRFLGREIHLPETGSAVVGRGRECEIVVDDPSVSRRHATFVCSESGLSLLDHGSRNGTQVNGVPVLGSQALAHRDRVQIGSHVFVVLGAGEARRPSSQSGRATTRRFDTAVRAGGALDAIEQALGRGDIAAASTAMAAIMGQSPEESGGVPDSELPRLSRVALSLCEKSANETAFAQVLQVHASRRIVPDQSVIDAMEESLHRLPFGAARAIEQYLDSMRERAASLSVQEQGRLRQVEAIARKARRGVG